MRAPAALLGVGLTLILGALWREESGAAHGFLLLASAAAAAIFLGRGTREESGWVDLPPLHLPEPERPGTAEALRLRTDPPESSSPSSRPPSRAAVALGLGPGRSLSRHATIAGVAAILLVAAAIRVPLLGEVPAGLFCDEAANGYNAFSLLETGRDEHGTPLPLFIPSFGVGLKNPAYVYAAMIPVALFGLDEASLRLTSAFYGVVAVFGLYLLGRALYNPVVGLLAALLLALSPWHIHFSRIAFNLIALPTFFILGLACLIRALERGSRRSFVGAAILLGITPYCYSVANVFVPLMLVGVVALYSRELWSQRRKVAPALFVLLLMLVPLLDFKLFDPRDVDRFSLIGIVQPGAALSQMVGEFADNYRQYLSFRFLFQEGDPILRHSVRGFGENLLSLSPWFLLGFVAAFARPRRGLLLACWLLTFPVAAALIRETPSATRSIVGAPLFPLLAAVGLTATWSIVALLRPRARVALRVVLVLAVASTIGVEAAHYLRSYFVEYPKYSAAGLDGFQYGYRQAIRLMEERRAEYDQLVLTATDVNQPWIFALFYTQRDPRSFHATEDTGYEVLIPEHYSRYDLDADRVLFAARPSDTAFFEEFEVLEVVKAPNGEVVYEIIEPRRRKRFLDAWGVIGPLPGDPAQALLAVNAASQGFSPVESEFVFSDLNDIFQGADNVCAVAATDIHLEGPVRDALLECIGSEDLFQPSLGGQRLDRVTLERRRPHRFPVRLETGANALRALTCDGDGDWYFACGIVDARGRSLEQVVSVAPRAGESDLLRFSGGATQQDPPRRVLSGGIEAVAGTLGEDLRQIDLALAWESGELAIDVNGPVLDGQLGPLLDGDTTSLVRSEDVNPFFITLTFRSPVRLKGVRVFPSYSSYDWGLQPRPEEVWLVIRNAADEVWSALELEQSVETSVVRLELLRREGDDYVHLNELELWTEP